MHTPVKVCYSSAFPYKGFPHEGGRNTRPFRLFSDLSGEKDAVVHRLGIGEMLYPHHLLQSSLASLHRRMISVVEMPPV